MRIEISSLLDWLAAERRMRLVNGQTERAEEVTCVMELLNNLEGEEVD